MYATIIFLAALPLLQQAQAMLPPRFEDMQEAGEWDMRHYEKEHHARAKAVVPHLLNPLHANSDSAMKRADNGREAAAHEVGTRVVGMDPNREGPRLPYPDQPIDAKQHEYNYHKGAEAHLRKARYDGLHGSMSPPDSAMEVQQPRTPTVGELRENTKWPKPSGNPREPRLPGQRSPLRRGDPNSPGEKSLQRLRNRAPVNERDYRRQIRSSQTGVEQDMARLGLHHQSTLGVAQPGATIPTSRVQSEHGILTNDSANTNPGRIDSNASAHLSGAMTIGPRFSGLRLDSAPSRLPSNLSSGADPRRSRGTDSGPPLTGSSGPPTGFLGPPSSSSRSTPTSSGPRSHP